MTHCCPDGVVHHGMLLFLLLNPDWVFNDLEHWQSDNIDLITHLLARQHNHVVVFIILIEHLSVFLHFVFI